MKEKKNKSMKYVKLFESWLNTVNEGLSGKIRQESLNYVLRVDEPYAQNKQKLGDHMAKLANKLTKNEIKFVAKIEKTDYISLIVPDSNNKFTFFCNSSKDFSSVDRVRIKDLAGSEPEFSESVNLLSIEGKATAETNYSDNTTFAQFILGVMNLKELTDSSESDCEDAIESILQLSIGEAPVLRGKKGSNTISKMTVEQFEDLTDKQVSYMFNTLLTVNKVAAVNIKRVKDSKYFIVDLNPKFAKDQGIEFKKYEGDGLSDYGGRHLIFTLDLAKPEEALADSTVLYGETNYKDSTSFNDIDSLASKMRVSNSADVFMGGQATDETNLAALIFGLRKFVQDGLKDKEGKKVADSSDCLIAMGNQIQKTDKKASSEAWKKEGGPADMTLKADASKEGMA